MDDLDQASLRALRWRVTGLPVRVGQTLLIAALLWLQLRSPLAIGWFVLAALTAAVDAELSRRLLARLADRRLAVVNAVSRAISAMAFASVCFVILIDHTGFGLSAGLLVGCAINLNNAVMSRGARRFFVSLVLPSSACLVALPLVAWASEHPLSLMAATLLTIGAGGYTVFILLLARALFRESEALRSALEAAEAASRAKSSFLAVTSHEIRTPLNGVLGMAQAMAADKLPRVQRDRVAVIQQSGQALLDILNDILDLAKIEAGKLELEATPFDLEAVVRSAAGAFSASALAKGLAYGLDFDEAARGGFLGDSARLRQVVCNLVSNAVKITEAGEVRVAVEACDGGVRIRVRDTGPGVSDELARRLFDKFVQADSSTTRKFGGTGLGLAICRELCEAMGGAISVAAAPDRGAVFTVELPLARAAIAAPAAPEPDALGFLAGDTPLRILAAEDNPVNQLVLRTLLDQLGVTLTIVDDGEDAVAAWRDGHFDLMLMDVQMPRMDGPTATRRIRAAEALTGRPRTPIVALTANVMRHQLDAYVEAGMDGFVAKPIAIADLYAAIARVTAARQASDAAAA
ncbi:MAG TPA: ATP-binding protein [Phenylobacterium sp.]|jgi:signal transduction histidine kinase/ActR/RegA family two-component response regulator